MSDLRARSALFTLFGDVVRPAGGDAWLTTLTACMGALGFTPEATRTALHRMAAEGWVAPTRVGRFAAYRLTDPGVARLEEAAARIYRLRAVDWDGSWRLLVCPAAGRSAAVCRELQWLGHGRLSGDTWISPHPPTEHLSDLLDAHGLSGHALRFDSAAVGHPQDNERIVATAWDLGDLRAAHAAFIAQWDGAPVPLDPEAAFTTRIRLVHHWRSFLFLDPGLPVELLPGDWLGDQAAGVFGDLYDALHDAAWRYYDALTDAAPALQTADANGRVTAARRREDNPLVHGFGAVPSSRSS